MLNLQEILTYLRDNTYVTKNTKDEWVFSEKFYHDLEVQGRAVVPVPKAGNVATLPKDGTEWQLLFIQLIEAAQVPKVLSDNRGGHYYANKYSEPAMKVFRKALEKDDVNYELLVKSVMLYYKSSVSYKKTISNYFTGGDWKTDYMALTQSISQGAEALTNHIQDELKSNTYDSYDWG